MSPSPSHLPYPFFLLHPKLQPFSLLLPHHNPSQLAAKLFATAKLSAPPLSYEPCSPGEFHLPRAKASSFSFRRSLAFSPTPKSKRPTTSHPDQITQTSPSPVCLLQDQSTQPRLPKHLQPLCKLLNLISIPYLSLLCCCPVLLINISISFFSLFLLLPFLLLFALFISLCELVPPFSLFDMLRRLLLITPLRFFFTLKARPLNFLIPLPPPRFATSPTCSALLCLSLLPLHHTPLFLPVLVLLLTATARRNSYLNNLLFLLSTQPLPSTTLSATAFTLLHIAGPPGPALLAAILPVLLLLTAAFPHWPLVLRTTLSSLPSAFSTLLRTAATHTISPPAPIPSTFFVPPSPPVFVVDTHGHALPLAPTSTPATLVPSVNATGRTPNSPPPQAPSPALSPPWDGSLTPLNHPKHNKTTTTLHLPQLNVRTQLSTTDTKESAPLPPPDPEQTAPPPSLKRSLQTSSLPAKRPHTSPPNATCSLSLPSNLISSLPRYCTIVDNAIHLPCFLSSRCPSCTHDHVSQFQVACPDTTSALAAALVDRASVFTDEATSISTFTARHLHPHHSAAVPSHLWSLQLKDTIQKHSRIHSLSLSMCSNFNVIHFPSFLSLNRALAVRSLRALSISPHILSNPASTQLEPHTPPSCVSSPFLTATTGDTADFSALATALSISLPDTLSFTISPTDPSLACFTLPNPDHLMRILNEIHDTLVITVNGSSLHTHSLQQPLLSQFPLVPIPLPHPFVTLRRSAWVPTRSGVPVDGPLPEHLDSRFLPPLQTTVNRVILTAPPTVSTVLFLAPSEHSFKSALTKLFLDKHAQLIPLPSTSLPTISPPLHSCFPIMYGLIPSYFKRLVPPSFIADTTHAHTCMIAYANLLHKASSAISPLLPLISPSNPFSDTLLAPHLAEDHPFFPESSSLSSLIISGNFINSLRIAGRLVAVRHPHRLRATLPSIFSFSCLNAPLLQDLNCYEIHPRHLSPTLPPAALLQALSELAVHPAPSFPFTLVIRASSQSLETCYPFLAQHFNILLSAPGPSFPTVPDALTLLASPNTSCSPNPPSLASALSSSPAPAFIPLLPKWSPPALPLPPRCPPHQRARLPPPPASSPIASFPIDSTPWSIVPTPASTSAAPPLVHTWPPPSLTPSSGPLRLTRQALDMLKASSFTSIPPAVLLSSPSAPEVWLVHPAPAPSPAPSPPFSDCWPPKFPHTSPLILSHAALQDFNNDFSVKSVPPPAPAPGGWLIHLTAPLRGGAPPATAPASTPSSSPAPATLHVSGPASDISDLVPRLRAHATSQPSTILHLAHARSSFFHVTLSSHQLAEEYTKFFAASFPQLTVSPATQKDNPPSSTLTVYAAPGEDLASHLDQPFVSTRKGRDLLLHLSFSSTQAAATAFRTLRRLHPLRVCHFSSSPSDSFVIVVVAADSNYIPRSTAVEPPHFLLHMLHHQVRQCHRRPDSQHRLPVHLQPRPRSRSPIPGPHRPRGRPALPDPALLIASIVAKPSLVTHNSSSAYYCSFTCHSDAAILLLYCNSIRGHTSASLVDNAPASFRSSAISFPIPTASFPDQVAQLLKQPSLRPHQARRHLLDLPCLQ